jgi:hypothetical protein
MFLYLTFRVEFVMSVHKHVSYACKRSLSYVLVEDDLNVGRNMLPYNIKTWQ